jgi:hypothetical protein
VPGYVNTMSERVAMVVKYNKLIVKLKSYTPLTVNALHIANEAMLSMKLESSYTKM